MNKLIALTTLLSILFAHPLFATDEEEYLKPDEAFRFQVSAENEGSIEATWQVAEGYYLYQKRFKFKSEDENIKLGQPQFPPGKLKDDPNFGKMMVHRNRVQVTIPYIAKPNADTTLKLKLGYQGCADLGLCYAPQTKKVSVELPSTTPSSMVVAAITAPDAALSSLADLGKTLGLNDSDEIPTAEEAYQFSVKQTSPDSTLLSWIIAPGTYLYQDGIKIKMEDPSQANLGNFQLPKAKIKKNALRPDGSLGDLPVYYDQLQFEVPIEWIKSDQNKSHLLVRYQGCADAGVCYPPVNKQIPLTPGPVQQVSSTTTAAETSVKANAVSVVESATPAPQSDLEEVDSILTSGNTYLIIGFFFGVGLLLAFTPCVFPMIPILSGIIAGQGTNITTRRAFTLSLVYVLAMAFTYTLAGVVVAGFFGESINLQAMFQNPWILGPFAVIFVLLSLSMFGFYELQLPSSWQSKLTEVSNHQKGGSLVGVAIMGLLSALIVGPCVAPPLAGALIYIAQTGDMILGGSALFALAMGMGTPVLIIGTSAGKLLPKAGGWMEAIKAAFGVGLLAVAIVLLERVIPAEVAMLLWGVLMITSAVYMGAFQSVPTDASGWRNLWKGLGLVLMVYGLLMLIGAAAGGKDTVQPLRGLFSGGSTSAHLQFKSIKSLDDLNREVSVASRSNQPVMLDFYADWCVSCKEMERYTFSDSKVISALAGYTLLQADVTAWDETDQALLQGHFGLPGPPGIMFYDRSGEEQKKMRVVGFKGADEFAQHIKRANP